MLIISFAAVIVHIAIHLFSSKFKFLDVIPRSRWLSFAGGISVAYVFLHLLPELAKGQEKVSEALSGWLLFIEHHIYILSLFGLVVFYGLERMAKAGRKNNEDDSFTQRSETEIFWIHMSTYAIYNMLIGYLLLHLEENTIRGLLFFSTAMAFHFLVNDFALNKHHGELYVKVGKWILSAAIIVGFLLGVFLDVSEVITIIIMAFLSGGIILNILKEELPEERKSHFFSFFLGAAFYSVLLLSI